MAIIVLSIIYKPNGIEEAFMKLRKVGIIGTGHVGSHVAFSLALQGEVDE